MCSKTANRNCAPSATRCVHPVSIPGLTLTWIASNSACLSPREQRGAPAGAPPAYAMIASSRAPAAVETAGRPQARDRPRRSLILVGRAAGRREVRGARISDRPQSARTQFELIIRPISPCLAARGMCRPSLAEERSYQIPSVGANDSLPLSPLARSTRNAENTPRPRKALASAGPA
jgi:hypothetical protein